MKKIYLIKISLIIFAVLFLLSCEKWIDPDINIDPDQASEVTMATILPSVEAYVAYSICGGSDIVGFQSVWLQQLDGVAGDFIAFSNYLIDPSSVAHLFEIAYSGGMMNAKVLMDLASEKNSPHNLGVAKICMAIFLGQLTDVFGDIPWSEALQGIEYPRPAYDSQEFIYEEIQRLLSEAVDHLSETNEPIGIDGDFFYNGDAILWLKAAHSLKARYHLHLTKRKGDQAFQDALTELDSAFTSSFDDMQFDYGPGDSESNPLYQFVRDMDEMRMGAFFIDMLKEYNDPRLEIYSERNDSFVHIGSEPGTGNTEASRPGPAVANAESPTFVMTFVECLFMKAEIIYKIDNDENKVRELLIQAVTESLNKFDVYDQSWMTSYSTQVEGLLGNDLFEELMTQKYIALFYQPEVYHSWRRTGFPAIPPNPLGAEDEIPRRFPYTDIELFFNKENVPPGVTITDRLWWDE